MLFFAWSLVLSAVNYARKQKLTAILQRHLYSPDACQTGFVCKKISKKLFGNFLTSESDSGPSSARTGALVRAPSEPAISRDSSVVLYRTEELEITVIPKPEPLQITDWTLFTEDIRKKSIFIPNHCPRVSFIAVIAVNENYTGSQDDLNKIVPVEGQTGQGEDNELNTDVHTGVAPVLISSIANQIAFRRHKPNEVLYETDLDNFYSVIFQWSESALFEFSGKGIIKEIQTVQLPDLAQKNENFLFSAALPYASTGALTVPSSFKNRKPFTLLEYLYLKDLFGELFDLDNEWRNLNVVPSQMNEYAFYRSDSALNRAISSPGSSYSSTRRRRTRRALPPTTTPSTRSSSSRRSCSPDIDIPSQSQIPAYLKELRKQNGHTIDRRRTCSLNESHSKSSHCSPSITLDDLLEDIKYIDYSSIEEESLESTTARESNPETIKSPRNKNSKIQTELESFLNNQETNSNGHQYSSESDKENPKNWFKNFRKLSTSKKFSRMAETLAKKFHLNVNNIENELVSETICRKRFASLVPGSEISQDIQKQRGSDMSKSFEILKHHQFGEM